MLLVSCDIYICMLASTKPKVARRFQVRNPNPDPSGSPRTGFLHCSPHVFHLVTNFRLTCFPSPKSSVTPLPKRQSNTAGGNYAETPGYLGKYREVRRRVRLTVRPGRTPRSTPGAPRARSGGTAELPAFGAVAAALPSLPSLPSLSLPLPDPAARVPPDARGGRAPSGGSGQPPIGPEARGRPAPARAANRVSPDGATRDPRAQC